MKKRVLFMMLAIGMAVSAGTGCAGNESASSPRANKTGYADNAELKVWGSQEDQIMLKGIIEDFKAEHPEAAGWRIQTAVVSAADAKTEVLKDLSAAADVFEFASDQIAELKSAGVLYRITKNKEKITADNIENSISAGIVDGELYGYPSSSNSFFMYYDKSKYTEEEVKSLNTMLKKELEPGAINFSMDIDNGWYTSSFFFGAGCKLFGEDGYDPAKCDFNNETGVLVGDYILGLASNPKVKNHDDALLLAAFKEKSLGAALTGTWNAEAIHESLGEDFGVTTVPAITLEDGTEVSPSTIVNFNLYGVNAQTKYPAESMLLAEYLTDEKAQKTRFEVRNSSPTNRNLVSDTELLNKSPAIAVLSEQVKTSTIQPGIPQVANFWGPLEAFGQGCIAHEVTKDNMEEKLDTMVDGILSRLGD